MAVHNPGPSTPDDSGANQQRVRQFGEELVGGGRAAGVVLDDDCYFRDIGSLVALELARNEWEGRTAS